MIIFSNAKSEEHNEKMDAIEDRIHQEEKNSEIILGSFLLSASGLNILEALIKILLRYIYADDTYTSGTLQSYLAFVKLGLVIIFYAYSLIKMKKLYFHSPYVRKLLFIWGIILIPVQLVYDLSILVFNRMLGMIWLILNTTYKEGNDVLYAMFYDGSHGFKYLGMFMAIILGLIITGVILERNKLIYISGILSILFMIFFAAINMKTMNLDMLSFNVGVNFTSLLFHLLTTIGLGFLGIYIIKSYREKAI